LAYLTNADLIAVDQDELGLQATLVSQDGTWDVLTKDLSNGDRLLTVLNRGNSSSNYEISLSRLGIYPKNGSSCMLETEDLWTGSVASAHSSSISITNIPPHGTAVLRVSRLSSSRGDIVPTGIIYHSASLHCLQSAKHGSVSSIACDGADGKV
jgi:alpha-galactosidase